MKVRIGSRKSDLARLQSRLVGTALQEAHPDLEIEYDFRGSEGDRDKQTPLWQFGDKGAFTHDLSMLLVTGDIDLAVHSWKDLPVQTDLPTAIVATLQRADSRDVLCFRKSAWTECAKKGSAVILSSSPRRAYNLDPFLRWALPAPLSDIRFEPVRGNMGTRIRKLLQGDGDALVLAKAALDRLLRADDAEYGTSTQEVRRLLRECYWTITPLSANPCAPAQGALAIEAAGNREDLRALVDAINVPSTLREVEREKEILRGYGGGCHQKIGAAVLERDFGTVTILRGMTDQGEILDRVSLEAKKPGPPPASLETIWPPEPGSPMFFKRRPLHLEKPELVNAALWVSRAEALPEAWAVPFETVVWTSGLETWRKLAKRGVWVHGSAEGLGEQEPTQLDQFLSEETAWFKLSHSGAPATEGLELLATYELVAEELPQEIREKTHFFWRSASQCEAALTAFPEIRGRWHSCGPGNSFRLIKKLLSDDARLSIFLSYEDWRASVLR